MMIALIILEIVEEFVLSFSAIRKMTEIPLFLLDFLFILIFGAIFFGFSWHEKVP